MHEADNEENERMREKYKYNSAQLIHINNYNILLLRTHAMRTAFNKSLAQLEKVKFEIHNNTLKPKA